MSTGETIKKYRKAKGMTQTELAEKMGITQSAIGKYESGDRTLSIGTVYELSDHLGKDFLAEVLGFSKPDQHIEFFKIICKNTGYSIQLVHEKVDESTEYESSETSDKLSETYYKLKRDSEDKEYVIDETAVKAFTERAAEHLIIDMKAFLKGADNGKAEENEG